MHGRMSAMIAATADVVLRICRLPGLNSPRVYTLLGLPTLQPLWERIARRRAVAAFHHARRRCPAYTRFLHDAAFSSPVGFASFSAVPETTKVNYVKKYSIEDRCDGGRIPTRGVVIDESSGSSGPPNNWVRSASERAGVRRMLHHGFALRFERDALFLINCFALGPWATGMNVSMSLVDAVILKSVGPDKQKLESTLRLFGPRYTYAIAGYPPFIKDFLDTTSLDLSAYELHLLVGGEGITEGLRDRFLTAFRTVHSSYGASDLEINIGAETPQAIAIRRLCVANTALCRALFGRDEPPMLFQYDPLDYVIETNGAGELIFTLVRPGYAAPRIRYNLHDVGGVLPHRRVLEILAEHAISPTSLPRGMAFPFLFVYGRSDLTVPFYGAKVFTTDVDAVLTGDAALRDRVHSFQIRTGHDERLNETLTIALERTNAGTDPLDPATLRDVFFRGLCRVNQDFREVSKMFTPDRITIEVHDFGAGPFAGRDIRVKNRYIADP